MLGEAYTLEYTELFGEELADAVRYSLIFMTTSSLSLFAKSERALPPQYI